MPQSADNYNFKKIEKPWFSNPGTAEAKIKKVAKLGNQSIRNYYGLLYIFSYISRSTWLIFGM